MGNSKSRSGTDNSLIDLNSSLSENTKGIVFIINNTAPPKDGAVSSDSQLVGFYSQLGDEYKVFPFAGVTRDTLLGTCQYLGSYKYPDSCCRIILHFTGRSEGAYLLTAGKKRAKSRVTVEELFTAFGDQQRQMEKVFFIDSTGSLGASANSNPKYMECLPHEGLAAFSTSAVEKGMAAAAAPVVAGVWTSILVGELKSSQRKSLREILVEVSRQLAQSGGSVGPQPTAVGANNVVSEPATQEHPYLSKLSKEIFLWNLPEEPVEEPPPPEPETEVPPWVIALDHFQPEMCSSLHNVIQRLIYRLRADVLSKGSTSVLSSDEATDRDKIATLLSAIQTQRDEFLFDKFCQALIDARHEAWAERLTDYIRQYNEERQDN